MVSGDDFRATATLRKLFQRDPSWLELVRRFDGAQLLEPEVLAKIIAIGN